MPAIERTLANAHMRAARIVTAIGRELRHARVSRGLSQRLVASAAGISQTQLSRIERGLYSSVTVDTLCSVGAVVGLELSARLFPAGEAIRDTAHAALLERFRKNVGEGWRWAAEVPLPIQGDRRAWDRLLRGSGVTIGVEAETKPMDMQDVQRRVALKKRDGQVDRVILVLADTTWCRQLLRLNDIDASFPVPGKVALKAMAAGRDPGGDAVVLI
jgi:transcriptional regulator with XRE-family HTH domain